jgi:hypothetical protein
VQPFRDETTARTSAGSGGRERVDNAREQAPEALNERGTPLIALDLLKNAVS